MNTIKTIEQMLKALGQAKETTTHGQIAWNCKEAIQAGRALLEELKGQEPVAWMSEENECIFLDADKPNPMDYDFWTPLYTHPQPKREPLTDEQESILNFLLGANDFEGVWYGERHPQKKGAFWWRDELRKAFQEAVHGIKE